MSRRAKHVCFYSKKCPHSKAFLEELARTPYTAEFQFICVDPSPTRAKLPSWLKSVPTLVIDGEADPVTDEKVFNWLSLRRIQGPGAPASRAPDERFNDLPKPQVSNRNEIEQSRYNPPSYDPTPPPQASSRMPEPINTRPTPNQQANQVAPPAATGEPDSYSLELSGSGRWSDAYSYIDDQFSIEKGIGGSRIERNFASLEGGPVAGGGRNQQQPIPEPQSEKARALNSAYDNYMKERNADIPSAPTRR
jgi:hypothetical protein